MVGLNKNYEHREKIINTLTHWALQRNGCEQSDTGSVINVTVWWWSSLQTKC